MKKCIISREEINNIIDTILIEEELKDSKDINIMAFDNYEFYKKYIFNKKNILSRLFSSEIILPFIADGSNNMSGDIVLLLDNISYSNNKEDAIYNLVEVIYHEIRHTKQMNLDDYSYLGFFNKVDKYLRIYNNYLLNHDKYIFEIDASADSMIKTRDFLKKYYPDVYDRYEVNINKRIDNYNNDMFLFDPVNKLSDFIGLYRYNKYHLKNDRSLSDISPVFDIFLDRKMNFKNVSEIVNDERFKKIDKRVVYSFFSIDSFLDSVDFNFLNEDEVNIIMESLSYTKNIYKEQLVGIDNYFVDNRNSLVDCFKRQKSLIKRIEYTYFYLYRYFFSSVYFLNNSFNKKRLIKKIDKVIVE